MKSEISFIKNIDFSHVNWEYVKPWILDCVKDEGFEVGVLSFVFLTDEALLEYNKNYLNHDFYTDVITFDDSIGDVINGDILISVERIIDNAKILTTNYKEEFLRVIIHGVLHLCGYKDKLDDEIKIMRKKEQYYLNQVSFN
jgi:rRNA maturation RNase YbeY